ncbi:hypothetical protein HJFPF1_12439 [Paramyrothecium foliicola]|nr:hypothetical protein HJFPF1_12439 [Paramyrothecium foliicola]
MYSSHFFLAVLLSTLRRGHAAPAVGNVENPFCTPFDTPPSSPVEPPADSRKLAGLGVEFESAGLTFMTALNSECTEDKYLQRKGEVIDDEYGQYMEWWMSGDTTLNSWNRDTKQGLLTAEYIMNGLRLKLGTGRAVEAAKKMSESWTARQYYKSPGKQVTIEAPDSEDDGCNNWFVTQTSVGDGNTEFSAQVTVPMPLNALSELFKLTKTRGTNKLLAFSPRKKAKMIWVTEKFFQENPEGVDGRDSEVRGFFSLLLTYAKWADTANVEESAKMLSSFMPRTNFVTMYNIIKTKISNVDLYKLAQKLACWENYNEGDQVDDAVWDERQGGEGQLRWCEVRDGKLEPTERMDRIKFTMKGNDGEFQVSVKEWIEQIATGEKDLLQEGDAKVDNQIGALGKKMEWVLNTQREAPIIEFRDLGATTAQNFEAYVKAVEDDVVQMHGRFKDAS